MTVSVDKAVVRLEQVSVRFGPTVAAQDLSFTVTRGERVAILGRTGAGKSTLLNLLIGNLSPTEGSVRVDGADPYLEHKKLQGLIGMAFQTPSLLPWLTALDNAAVGLRIIGINRKESRERAMEWLAKVNLAHAADRYPSQLSGGMRQRVSLARAFAIEPKLVLLDESFSALDEVTANQLRNDFIQLSNDTNATALIVTHSIEEAFVLGHRVLVFDSPAQIVGEYGTSKYPVGDEQFALVRQEIHELMRGANSSASPVHTKSEAAISGAGLNAYSREVGTP